MIDADDHPTTGTGIVMPSVSAAALADALASRGVALWRDRSRRAVARTNGMTPDWSWKVPAAQHIDLYRTTRTPTKPVRQERRRTVAP